MTSLRKVWALDGFRRQLRSFVDLPEDGRQRIFEFVTTEMSGENLLAHPLSEDESKLVPLVGALIGIRDSEGITDLVADLQALENSADWTLVEVLEPLLSARPETPEEFRARANGTGLPVLQRFVLHLDLRAVPRTPDVRGRSEDQVLHPLAVVRLGFDEHVSGSDAIAFQASRDTVLELREAIDEFLTTHDAVVGLIPDSLLPPEGDG